MSTHSIKPILIATAVGAIFSWGTLTLTADDSAHLAQLAALENRILDLEMALVEKEQALARARAWALDLAPNAAGADANRTHLAVAQKVEPSNGQPTASISTDANPVAAQDAQQALKDLGTLSDRDPRSFADKIADLLAANASEANVAIASQSIADMASNAELLPDHALQSLHQSQTHPEIKRVAAQVLSLRGDNTLMDQHVNDALAGLRSESAVDRQKTLVELAKTRYAGAATVIAPLLNDPDIGVKLDALLALRATGNQSHIHWVEPLRAHPDPSVSWLANDVATSLENLSEKARTRLVSNDIAAELPVLTPSF